MPSQPNSRRSVIQRVVKWLQHPIRLTSAVITNCALHPTRLTNTSIFSEQGQAEKKTKTKGNKAQTNKITLAHNHFSFIFKISGCQATQTEGPYGNVHQRVAVYSFLKEKLWNFPKVVPFKKNRFEGQVIEQHTITWPLVPYIFLASSGSSHQDEDTPGYGLP